MKTVVTDIDGCLTEGRGKPIDLEMFSELRDIGERLITGSNLPWIVIITARPQPYLEAILQMIGEKGIGLFEWGSGMFFAEAYRCVYHPTISHDLTIRIGRFRAGLAHYLAENGAGFIQPGKEVALTIYPTESGIEARDKLHTMVDKFLESEDPILHGQTRIESIRTFVNIMPAGVDKHSGLAWLLREIGMNLEDCVGIGDSEDDLSFMTACGKSAAPSNAEPAVRQSVDYVSASAFGKGVVDCIRKYLV